jgi:choline dehydrogenase
MNFIMMRFERMQWFKTFELPTVIKSGIGAAKHIGEEVKNLGVTKALVVCDAGIVKAGIVEPIIKTLNEAGVETR